MFDADQLRRAMGLMTIGLEFIAAGFLPILGGIWCDNRLNTGPWLTITGLMVGLIAATYNLIRRVQAATKRERKPDNIDRKR